MDLNISGIRDEDLTLALENLDVLPKAEQIELDKLLDLLREKKTIQDKQDSFLSFAQAMDANFLVGEHHKIIARTIEKIASGELKRVVINIAPRHGKSHIMSYLFPAWFMGKFPDKKIIMASHTADLAVDFGRKVRNLVADKEYQKIFPDVNLQADSKASGRWGTNHGGEYYACGVGGALAGRGAHLCIIDDPHSEQEAKTGNPAVFDSAYEWYQSGPRQRLMPGGAICLIMTRWGKRDLTGRILDNMLKNEGSDQWEIIELPMELPSGEPLWPEFWSKKDIELLKNTLDNRYWQAQYQQQPTSEGAAIVKREWWREWEEEDPPRCEYIIQSWDTAFEKSNRADYSACTTWGVFYQPDDRGVNQANIILLDAFKDRMEFPELKKKAYEMYKDYDPDSLLIEKKASGAPLLYELRAMGIIVAEVTPTKDKITRLNAVADLFSSGMVWAPATRWAEAVKEEVADFPVGAHDDYVDSMTQALDRFRRGGFIRLDSDEAEAELEFKRFSSQKFYAI
jgi:predicted phage terminase large subunit-like protein